jgi:DAK2 domain fusion protein YloV
MTKKKNTAPGEIRHAILGSPVNGMGLFSLFEAGLAWLQANQAYINSLNVFPVPDGDTGTNMVLTMQAALREAETTGTENVGEMAKAIAQGALMGARGNSGVILSQIWRGFSRSLDSLPTMDTALLLKGLNEARDTAYKGVVKPVEGTILTVIKDIATSAQASFERGSKLNEMLSEIVEAAQESVKRTPDLLPILKQAGVVDSGGTGLAFIFEGMDRFARGESLEVSEKLLKPLAEFDLEHTLETVEDGQDYEVVLDFKPKADFNLQEYYKGLEPIGTSIQVGEGDGIYRMHIHTELAKRFEPIAYTEGLGVVKKVMMENLRDQMNGNKVPKEIKLTLVEKGQTGVVAVSPGEGLSRIFASLGANALIKGGQTMNPSVKDILAAIESLPTDSVIVLPNNKNVILAAENAAKATTKKVAVVPSRNAPQGFSALLRLMPDCSLDENLSSMKEAIQEVHTGEITTASRSVEIEGVQVEKDQVIALFDGKLVTSASTIEDACQSLFKMTNIDQFESITLFYGQDMPLVRVNGIADDLKAKYPSHSIEVHEGGQPHYQLIIAFE